MANRKQCDIPANIWNAMRTDYISSDKSSFRQLEKNYGVSFNKIRKRALEEDWQGKREEFRTNRANKSLDLVADFQAEECAKAFKVACKLLDKIESSVDAVEDGDTGAIKQLTSAIKDLKEIGVFRSDMDRLEQQARIRKLQKDAEEDHKDSTITVVFEGDMEGDFD